MFQTIFENQYLIGASGMASIIGLAVLVFQFFSSRAKRVYVQHTSKILVGRSPSSAIQQEVEIDGVVSHQVRVDTFVVLNKLGRALTDEEFLTQPFIEKNSATAISKIVKLSGLNGSSFSWNAFGDRVELTQLKMPRNAAIGFAVFHDGSVSNSLEAVTKEISDFKPSSFATRRQFLSVKNVLDSLANAVLLSAALLFWTGMFLGSEILFSNSIWQEDWFFGAMIFALFVLLYLAKNRSFSILHRDGSHLSKTRVLDTALLELENGS